MEARQDAPRAETMDARTAAVAGCALNRLACAGALMRGQLDGIILAARTEPDAWPGSRVEVVIATLDGIAAMAAREADRLRDLEDRRSR